MEYKTNLSNPSNFQQYYDNESKQIDEHDLADDNVNKLILDIDFLFESIENTKDDYNKRKYNNILNNLKYWCESIKLYGNLISKSFLRKTDFCKLLIEIASDKQYFELQYYAFLCIAQLMDISYDSIDEFIGLYAMSLFAEISYNQKPKILLLGYHILSECLNTQNGLNAFVKENVVFRLIDTFDTFLQIPELSEDCLNCITQISYIFVKLLNFNIYDQYPEELPKKILNVFLHALNAKYNQFFVDSVTAATSIVVHMKDDGNQIILDTNFLGSVINELNTGIEERLLPLLDLLIHIFSQVGKELKIKLFNTIPQKLLVKQFLYAQVSSNVYIKIMNIICNCFICGLNYNWILQPQSLNKIREVYQEGDFVSKEVTSKCLMIAVYVASPPDCEELINLDVLISAVQSISSLSDRNNIIKMLQILNSMFEKIYRNDLQRNIDLENEIVEVLHTLNTIDDSRISLLIESIMKYFFSEIYYDQK